jgi:hypothetical protein
MWKVWIGVGLGMLAFVLYMLLGELSGSLPLAFGAVAAYLFVCQFFLSRGHVNAHRKDWRIMLGLAAPLLVTTAIMVLVERREVILAQGPVVLFACAGVYAGAGVASLRARAKEFRPVS